MPCLAGEATGQSALSWVRSPQATRRGWLGPFLLSWGIATVRGCLRRNVYRQQIPANSIAATKKSREDHRQMSS